MCNFATVSLLFQASNFLAFEAIISGMKNPALDPEKKEAKQRSMDSMAQYVNKRVGIPIEKLSVSLMVLLM